MTSPEVREIFARGAALEDVCEPDQHVGHVPHVVSPPSVSCELLECVEEHGLVHELSEVVRQNVETAEPGLRVLHERREQRLANDLAPARPDRGLPGSDHLFRGLSPRELRIAALELGPHVGGQIAEPPPGLRDQTEERLCPTLIGLVTYESIHAHPSVLRTHHEPIRKALYVRAPIKVKQKNHLVLLASRRVGNFPNAHSLLKESRRDSFFSETCNEDEVVFVFALSCTFKFYLESTSS